MHREAEGVDLMSARFEHIPAALRELDQWVCIRSDSKVPMKAWACEAASSTDPETWASFATVCRAVSEGYYDDIGFVFNDNEIIGIDIDIGYDEDGFLSSIASDILGKCQSYTERSRSGRGFHVLVRGTLPFNGKNNLNGVEIYKTCRYFIMTGDTMLYRNIAENQEAIDYVVEKYFPETLRTKSDDLPSGRVYVPVWEKPSNRTIRLRPLYPRIPDGCRNICLTSLAGTLHSQGYSREQIYDELLYCNTIACDPPLERGEIRTIVNSITRYKR